MCEPYHSITQFPPDDSGPGNSGGGEVTEHRLQWGLRGIWDWAKKIGRFFHISRLGSGHTESLEWASTNGLILPRETRYESAWWSREVKLDGKLCMPEEYKDEAVESAERYAWQVSLGNLTLLRRFLEISMRKSEQVHGYVLRFVEDFIRPVGRDLACTQLGKVIGCDLFRGNWIYVRTKINENLEGTIKCLLGLTRKRLILHPAWSDDDSIWV